MGLEFAIDELYASGWSALDTAGCSLHPDGRVYPSIDRVAAEFSVAGFAFAVRHIQLFDCFRAEWRDAAGTIRGAVVGRSAAEASVFALAQLRRSGVSAPARTTA